MFFPTTDYQRLVGCRQGKLLWTTEELQARRSEYDERLIKKALWFKGLVV